MLNQDQLSITDKLKVSDLSDKVFGRQEKEKLMLLSFSNDIASARNKKDLAAIIKLHLKNLFLIDGYIITVRNADCQSYSHFMHDIQVEPASDDWFKSDTESAADCPLTAAVLSSEQPVFFDIDEVLFDRRLSDYCGAFWRSAGIDQIMGLRLKVANEDFAILWSQPGQVNDHLMKGICSQIAIAISNVLANEEICKSNREKEFLLSLNTDIATVRSSDDLLKILNHKLQALLDCNHTGLANINDDLTTVSTYLIDEHAASRINPLYSKAIKLNYPMNDGILDKAMSTPLPVVFDLDKLYNEAQMPLYIEVNYKSGLKELVITRLSNAEGVFGFWLIFFEKKQTADSDKLNLIKCLANQISIAVSHIVANEEIHRRELEKTRLLDFSNAVASVRESKVLSCILKEQLKKLFNIDDYVIHALSEDKKRKTPILYDPAGTFLSYPGFVKLLNTETDLNDGNNVTLKSTGPVIHNMEALTDLTTCLTLAREFNLKQIVGVTLRIAQENIAIMNFRLEDRDHKLIQSYLFTSICSQIAIAVSNVIANEKVVKQLNEISIYKEQLEEEKIYLKEEIQTTQNFYEIIGDSPSMQKTFRLVTQVASSNSTVLLLGETGTGKEVIARAIHNNSPRKNKLMVKVNCAALPANLIESELFGHERGSFTGATERRLGKFELAHNGTLFLDEIGEMPLNLQVKLLRALQEKEIERVGGKSVIKVDVRIIAATNRDLEKEMEEGRFRSDLYYRLNIFPIYLSPLRERQEDIPLLATHFINRYSKKTGKKISMLSNKVLQELVEYNWPGNIRELEHLIERSVLLANGSTLKQIHLPGNKQSMAITNKEEFPLKTIDENERDHIMRIIKHCKGRISGKNGAAEILGVPVSTLNSKLKRLEIKREHIRINTF